MTARPQVRTAVLLPLAALTAIATLTACGQSGVADGKRPAARSGSPTHDGSLYGAGAGSADPGSGSVGAGKSAPTPQGAGTATVLPTELPGLGPRTLAQIAPDTRQALVVTGEGKDSTKSAAVLYERTAEGWRAASHWPAQNARHGWTDHHVQGDLRSPIGVFGLTDAGGLLADPGTKLPYDRSDVYAIDRADDSGQSLQGSFDYVVAVNYNRYPGRTPVDWGRPLGSNRGGGIWIHVEHTTPTSGCVALKRDAMRDLLRALDPAKKPVVVMGPGEDLAK